MLADRADWVCVPIDVYSDLTPYFKMGIKVCIQKIMFVMNGLMSKDPVEHETAKEHMKRVSQWLQACEIKMVDDVDTILEVQDRIGFIQKFNSFMNTQPMEIQEMFGTPVNFEFSNKGTIEQKVAAYR